MTIAGAFTSLASVQTPPCTSVGVTPSPASPQSVSTAVTFTASAVGCTFPEYQVWLHTPGTGWALVQDWMLGGFGPTYQQTSWPTAGLYYVHVFARQYGATVDQAQTQISYTITAPGGCTGASLSLDAFPPVSAGTTVTATATASGCTNPLYRFWRLDPGGVWTVVQEYSTVVTYAWDSTGAADGPHYFGVWMKQSGSGLDPEASATAGVTIGPGAATGFSLTPTQAQTDAGVPVEVTVRALTPSGATDTGYRGTVRLTSDDPTMSPGRWRPTPSPPPITVSTPSASPSTPRA